MNYQKKRLFFGCPIEAPWPETLPLGRCIETEHRHMTLAFLGETPASPLLFRLEDFPSPPATVGWVGQFDQCLFLPPGSPRVVAWQGKFSTPFSLVEYLHQWLQQEKIAFDNSYPFLPHVTLCRSPFCAKDWLAAFQPLPFAIHTLHLYESQGNLRYIPLRTWHFLPPFEECAHTADRAFCIRGTSYEQLFFHAQTALAFHYPSLLPFISSPPSNPTWIDVVQALNALIARVDAAIGCPFKAVSLHGQVTQYPEYLEWSLVIDV